MSRSALDAIRAAFPLSVSRKVSARHVEVFANYVLRDSSPSPAPAVSDADELAWLAARRSALRLAGVYLPFERAKS